MPMKLCHLFLISLIIFTGDCFASATSADFEPCKKLAVKSLESCFRLEGRNTIGKNCWDKSLTNTQSCYKNVRDSYDINKTEAIRQKAERYISAQKLLDELMTCANEVDMNVKNDLVITCLAKLTSKDINNRTLRDIARWTQNVTSYQSLKKCDEAILNIYPRATSEKHELVLCFDFEISIAQTGLVYYLKQDGALKVHGIQFDTN